MEKCTEYWKDCVNWLVRCEVLRPDHQTLQNEAHIEDLAYTLRDGVLLCILINNLNPDCINMENVNQNPGTTKCLCIQNIDIFLKTCRDIFGMRAQDLFESSMLFDLTGFYQVLVTLSILSNTPKARQRTSYGFSLSLSGSNNTFNKLRIGEIDTRRSFELSENASLSTHRESMRQDAIYEKLVTVRQEKLAHNNKKKEKRDFIIEEIISNEKSYLEGVLKSVLEYYMKPLKTVLNPYDTKAIFGDMEKLTELHEDFYKDLLNSSSPANGLLLSEVFLNYYHRFLMYGDYCANLPRALELLKSITSNKVDVKDMLNTCHAQLKHGRFFLSDMLVVPMQHVLKYRLLLERLRRETPENYPEAIPLQKAYEIMVDVNNYVNDVKRDREALQTIEKIESRIIDLRMPGNKTLKDFGRLHKDDELRIKFPDQKVGNRYVFIFDQVLLICKTLKDGTYACQEALNLASYKVKDMQVSSRWGHHWRLMHKIQNIEYVVYARNEEHKRFWMQALLEALDNIDPFGSKTNDHSFVMYTFEKPTMCHFCEKSLKGLIMQGYSCHYCKLVVHKACIKDADLCTASFQTSKQQTELPSLQYGVGTNWNDYRFLHQYPWFGGVLQRKEADKILEVKRRGTFMLRIRPKYPNNSRATNQTEYAISLKTISTVAHMIVFKQMTQGNPSYYLSDARYFPSIVELVEHYNHWPLQENYEELDETLILPYNITSEVGISSENFNAKGEETEDENVDYFDMNRAEEKTEKQHDSRHDFNCLPNISETDLGNPHYHHQCSANRLSEVNGNEMSYENVTIQSPRKKKSISYGYETEDDSNASASFSQDFDTDVHLDSLTNIKPDSPPNRSWISPVKTSCSQLLNNQSTQTENTTIHDINEEDIEKFGEYIVAALKLFKNSRTLRELTNEIRKTINVRLDSEQ